MNKYYQFSIFFVALIAASAQIGWSQENPGTSQKTEATDEVIVEGQRNWDGNKAMDAFFNGDYVTAEIEFERNFIKLKRIENARLNAIDDTVNGIDRGEIAAAAGGSNGVTISSPGGAVSVSTPQGPAFNPNISGNFRPKKKEDTNIFNDGITNEDDFAFNKYMAGLSELQLGKYSEAKKSFKTSLSFSKSNYDARMRLGLLYVQESEIEKAAKQLEKLDGLRKKCKKKGCDEYGEINQSSLTLANAIINHQQ
jgi:tetratricopeptide (TPR) repeat protein